MEKSFDLFLKIIIVLIAFFALCDLTNTYGREIIVHELHISENPHWVVTKDSVSVAYPKDKCGYLSKSVLLNVAYDSDAGVFDWTKMNEQTFRDKVLDTECIRLKKEMRLRGSTAFYSTL